MNGLIARTAAVVVVATLMVVACGDDAPPDVAAASVPPLVAPDVHWAISVERPPGADSFDVPAALSDAVLPFLVARVFDAAEPDASYGLDSPDARIELRSDAGEVVVLDIGDENFDSSAYYLRRHGDGRVWLVLDDSIDPLLQAAER